MEAKKDEQAKAPAETKETKAESVVKDSEDVSDSALRDAFKEMVSSEGEADEKVVTEKTENKEENKSEEEKSDDGIDKSIEAILSSLPNEVVEKPKGQTLEQRLKELERKNKDLYEENKSLKSNPKVEENKPVDKEKFLEYIQNEFDMDEDKFLKMSKFVDRYIADAIGPQLQEVKKKLSDSELKSVLKDDKLYNQFKDEIELLVESDPDLQALPKAARYKWATQAIKDKYTPELVESVRKQERVKAAQNKKIIPSGGSQASTKVTSKSDIKLTEADRRIMKHFELTDEDVSSSNKLNLK